MHVKAVHNTTFCGFYFNSCVSICISIRYTYYIGIYLWKRCYFIYRLNDVLKLSLVWKWKSSFQLTIAVSQNRNEWDWWKKSYSLLLIYLNGITNHNLKIILAYHFICGRIKNDMRFCLNYINLHTFTLSSISQNKWIA